MCMLWSVKWTTHYCQQRRRHGEREGKNRQPVGGSINGSLVNRSTSLWINRSFGVDPTHTWGAFSFLGSSGVVAEEGLFHLYVHTYIRWASPSAGERRGDPGPLFAAALTGREGWKDPPPDAVPLHGLAWPQHPVQPRRSADNDRGCTRLPQEDGHTHGRPLQVNVVAHPCGQKEKKKER